MANETAELLVKISATTELLRQQMIAAENTVERTTKNIQRDLDKVDSGFGKIGKSSGALASGFGKANAALSSFTGNLAADVVGQFGAALGDMAKGAFELGSSLAEASSKLGVTVDELQRYRYIADQVGISQEEMDAGLSKLNRSIGQADAGNKKLNEAFGELNVSVRTSNGELKTAGQIMPELVAKISAIPEPAKRAALEVALFGKSGQNLENLLGGGSDALAKLSAEFDRLGIALSKDQADQLDAAADAIAKFKAQAQGTFTIFLADALPLLNEDIEATRKEIEFLIAIFKKLEALVGAGGKFLSNSTFAENLALAGRIATGNAPGAARIVGNVLDRANAPPVANTPRAIQPLNRFQPAPGRGPLKGGFGGVLGLGGAALTFDLSSLLAEAAAIEQIGAKARAALPAVAGLTQELNALGRADLERPAGVDFNGASGAEQISALVAAADERLAAEQDVNKEITADYLDRMNNATQFAAAQFEDLFRGGIGDVWDNFQRIGEQVIAQVAAKFLIAMLSKDGLSGAGGIGGILSSAFSSVLGFANGGMPPVGKVSMVGERGPELFIPRVPGTIISNDNLRGIGGGATQNITINAPGATAETVIAIRREIANAAPALIGAAKRETFRDSRRGRL